MKVIRGVVAAGLAGMLAGGLVVGPAIAAVLDPVASLPNKVTLTYKGAALDEVKVAIPQGDITCAVSPTDGWTTRVVGRAIKVSGVKVTPVTVTDFACVAATGTAPATVTWIVRAKDLTNMKNGRANAVVKFIATKGGVQTVQTLVVKVEPVAKVTGKR